MTTVSCIPVCGTVNSDSGAESTLEPLPSPEVSDTSRLGSFGRLVSIHQRNEILLQELSRVNTRLGKTHAYLASPGSASALGQAYLLRLRARRSAALTLLRASEFEARNLLSRLDDDLILG